MFTGVGTWLTGKIVNVCSALRAVARNVTISEFHNRKTSLPHVLDLGISQF
jgi:hypothetical protein